MCSPRPPSAQFPQVCSIPHAPRLLVAATPRFVVSQGFAAAPSAISTKKAVPPRQRRASAQCPSERLTPSSERRSSSRRRSRRRRPDSARSRDRPGSAGDWPAEWRSSRGTAPRPAHRRRERTRLAENPVSGELDIAFRPGLHDDTVGHRRALARRRSTLNRLGTRRARLAGRISRVNASTDLGRKRGRRSRRKLHEHERQQLRFLPLRQARE